MSAEINVPDERLDLGHEHFALFRRRDGAIAGLVTWHKCKGVETEGWIPFKNDGWVLESESPLTISPSLACMNCPDHGHIRNGKWEIA